MAVLAQGAPLVATGAASARRALDWKAAAQVRQPRPSDVLAAVEYVTGTNPVMERSREKSVVAARRLACQALSEITDSSQEESARVLYVDRSTVSHHLSGSWDYGALRLVVDRVSQALEAEEADQERRWIASLTP